VRGAIEDGIVAKDEPVRSEQCAAMKAIKASPPALHRVLRRTVESEAVDRRGDDGAATHEERMPVV
jgi:hypothetical protein